MQGPLNTFDFFKTVATVRVSVINTQFVYGTGLPELKYHKLCPSISDINGHNDERTLISRRTVSCISREAPPPTTFHISMDIPPNQKGKHGQAHRLAVSFMFEEDIENL